MNKKELVDIIRTVVREEVNNSLPQLLMEVLAEKITSNQDALVETRAPVAPAARQKVGNRPATDAVIANVRKKLVTLDAPLKQAPVAAPRVFSSNPALNAVLNETVGGVPSQDEADSMSAIDTINNLPQEVLQENTAVAAVANALTRDYSKILKAVEAKVRR